MRFAILSAALAILLIAAAPSAQAANPIQLKKMIQPETYAELQKEYQQSPACKDQLDRHQAKLAEAKLANSDDATISMLETKIVKDKLCLADASACNLRESTVRKMYKARGWKWLEDKFVKGMDFLNSENEDTESELDSALETEVDEQVDGVAELDEADAYEELEGAAELDEADEDDSAAELDSLASPLQRFKNARRHNRVSVKVNVHA